MQHVQPIMVVDLFPQERRQLLLLFSELEAEDWEKPTSCPGWSVKDIGLHLLGDDIGYLSRARDQFSNPFFQNKDLHEWKSLVKNINEANELWVKAAARLSPKLLADLLELTGRQFHEYVQSLDQMATGGVVSWAGPDPAPVWLDTAREYTERWVHQQHIRDAVEQPGLKERRWLDPVLETFVYALHQALRQVNSPLDTTVQLVVTGDAGGTWSAVRTDQAWALSTEAAREPDARVTIDQEIAWRLFTKGLSKDEALPHIGLEGNSVLADKVLDMVSIIA